MWLGCKALWEVGAGLGSLRYTGRCGAATCLASLVPSPCEGSDSERWAATVLFSKSLLCQV